MIERALNTISDQADFFIEKIPSFGPSEKQATLKYDSSRLLKVLRKKELFQVARANDQEFDMVDQIDIDLGRIVKDLVFQKNLDNSLMEYEDYQKKIEEVPRHLYLYARQTALSVKSLYFYKKEFWDQAISLSEECAAINDYLVHQGMQTLLLRVMEQNKNIARIYLKSGDSKAASELLAKLFRYAFNGENTGLFGSVFNFPQYWEKLPALRETYTYEMFRMTAEDHLRFNIERTSVEFLPFQWYEGLEVDPENINRAMIADFIAINRALQDKDYDTYFQLLLDYFQNTNIQYYDILKVSLLIDFQTLLIQQKYHDLKTMQNRVLTYLKNNLHVSERYQKAVLNRFNTKNNSIVTQA